MRKHILISILFLLSPPIILCQEEPLYDHLQETFKSKALSIGILFQSVGDFQIERSFPGNNGFNISNARINLYGELDNGFGYLFKTNLINSPPILDAKAYYHLSPQLIMDVGLFKPPFSKEFLTGAGGIDFVNRAQIVSALAGSRQIGLQVRGTSSENIISYGVGMFNGNRFNGNNNDNNDFMFVGRVAVFPKMAAGNNQLEAGMNIAFSNDNNSVIGAGILPTFNGKRTLYGADARWTHDDLMLSAEMIGAHLDHRAGGKSNPYGYHLTGAYMITPKSQVLIRLDSFMPDGLVSDSRLLIFGYNLWPTKVTELQVNYIILTQDSDIKHHQVLVNAQFSF